jgi:hypothetical protein
MTRSLEDEATIASALGCHVWETKAYWTVQEGLVVSGTTERGQQEGHRANLCFVCSPTVTIEYQTQYRVTKSLDCGFLHFPALFLCSYSKSECHGGLPDRGLARPIGLHLRSHEGTYVRQHMPLQRVRSTQVRLTVSSRASDFSDCS